MRLSAALLAGFLSSAAAGDALADSLVLRVNGQTISSFDVEQRIRVEAVTAGRKITRQQAIDILIEDRLKLQEARRVGFRVGEEIIDKELERIASNNKQSRYMLEEELRRRGVDVQAVRDRFRADLAWNSLIAYLSRTTSPSNSIVNQAVEERAKAGKNTVYDYSLTQVIFIVPGGAGAGILAQRQREALAARNQFHDCESGLLSLKVLRDVAVRAPVSRSSTDLPKPINDLISKTQVGKLTQPFPSDQGVEMLAVCERKERQDNLQARNEVETEITNKKSETIARDLLKDLRAKAQIEKP